MARRVLTQLGVVFGVVLGAGFCGCETIGQDVSDWATGLFPPSPSEAAAMAADQNDADRRRQGIVYLENAPFGGNPPYLALYRDYVREDNDPLVRAVAIRGLGRWGDPADALLVAPKLEDENMQVRWEAAKALQRLHQPQVVGDLMDALSNGLNSSDVRVAAAIALGQYPQDRVFQVLIAALDQRELAVNAAAAQSLRVLTGEDHGMEAPAWLASYDARADPFADGEEFLYPTYHRKDTFFEMLAFWSTRFQEQPGIPAGLAPRDERRTSDFRDEMTPTGEPGSG